MPGFDGRQDLDGDEQDQSEVFDEENFEAADPGFDFGDMKTFEENPEVLDLTARLGDADDDDRPRTRAGPGAGGGNGVHACAGR